MGRSPQSCGCQHGRVQRLIVKAGGLACYGHDFEDALPSRHLSLRRRSSFCARRTASFSVHVSLATRLSGSSGDKSSEQVQRSRLETLTLVELERRGSASSTELMLRIIGAFPADSHAAIVYPVAAIVTAKPEAVRYLAHLCSMTAKVIFEQKGLRFLIQPTSYTPARLGYQSRRRDG